MLKINLSSFEDYTELELETDGAELSVGDTVKIDGVVKVGVSITKESVDSVLVTGAIAASILSGCVRCLEETAAEVSSDFTAVFKAKGALTAEDKEDETYTYDDNSIDLAQLIKDELLLALPMKQVCSEDCRGLCLTCGKNRNKEKCGCKTENKLNPFEALDRFKAEN